MSRVRLRVVAELALAVAAALGCLGSWSRVRVDVAVAPILVGEPATVSVNYHPQWLALTLLAATVAGVLVVVAVGRAWHARRR